MIQMLRKEACSGSIDDLAHIRTEVCLSDCLTKHSAKPDTLLKAVRTGVLPDVDMHPSFRDLMQHKAYAVRWLSVNVPYASGITHLLGEDVIDDMHILYGHGGVHGRVRDWRK